MSSPHPILPAPVALPLGWASGGARYLLPVRPVFFVIRIRRRKAPTKVARPQARAASGAAGVVDYAPAAIGGL